MIVVERWNDQGGPVFRYWHLWCLYPTLAFTVTLRSTPEGVWMDYPVNGRQYAWVDMLKRVTYCSGCLTRLSGDPELGRIDQPAGKHEVQSVMHIGWQTDLLSMPARKVYISLLLQEETHKRTYWLRTEKDGNLYDTSNGQEQWTRAVWYRVCPIVSSPISIQALQDHVKYLYDKGILT